MSDPLQELIAHYIATTYPTALQSFLQATGLPPPNLQSPPNPDLRTLAQDYASSNLAQAVGELKVDDKATDGSWRNWTAKDVSALSLAPEVNMSGVVRNIDGVSAANLLATLVARVPKRIFDTSTAAYMCSYKLSILASSVDKTVSIIDYETGEVTGILQQHKAAVLSFAQHPIHSRYLLTGSMDGTTVLTDLVTQQAVQTYRSAKFVVRVAFSLCGKWMATASYDKHIVVYHVESEDQAAEVLDDTDDPFLACDPNLRFKEWRRIKVDHNPEALLFHPASDWLIHTTRSSHNMSYVSLRHIDDPIRTKSFNPHPLDTHISFSILNMALHPSGKIVACQTGDHAGNAGERILLYGVDPDETERLGCIWTGSDTDDYVLPRMAWLPDGSGLITTSPNGLLHLLSISGEIRSSLKVHGSSEGENASASGIIRDCAIVEQGGGTWEVVSVGYDKVVRISR